MTLGHHTLKSPFADQLRRGFRTLRFQPFVEEEFRQAYAEATAPRARLVLGVALGAMLVLLGAELNTAGLSLPMLAFEGLILAPVLIATLHVSAQPARYRLYQLLLAFAVLLVGLVINSIVMRATLNGMPYYFSASIAWVLTCWMILGLPFRAAAGVALAASLTYVAGLFYWDVSPGEAAFEVTMLAVVNGIGAFCGYQLEFTVRRSFLESRTLAQLAERDGLTGLYNRRSFDQYLERVWRQSRREQTQLTLLLIDIDAFKAYNDLKGHQAGDDALKQVATVIGTGAQRPLDFAARYGGEEFALILYGPGHEFGHDLPDRLREAVLGLKIAHAGSATGPYLSVSVGVAIVTADGERSMAGALQMADEALYGAKEAGGNCVVVRESSDSAVETGRFRVARSLGG